MNRHMPLDGDASRELRDRVHRAVPPMSLDPDAVLATARTRRRRRTAGQLTTGALAIAAVVVGAVQVGALDGGGTVPADPAPDQTEVGPGPDPTDTSAPDGTTEPAPVALGPYMCGNHEISPAVLESGRPASDLSPASLAALESMDLSAVPELASWTVLEETNTRIALIRPTPGEAGTGILPYETYGIELVPPGGGAVPFNDTNHPIWSMSEWSSCTVQAHLDGLRNVHLQLDPMNPPSPDAISVVVLVTEAGCTGGLDPSDRVRVLEIRYTETSVEIVVGTVPPPGDVFTCIGNTPVPVTIELDEPIGDRYLVDATVYPAQAIQGSR